MALTMSPAPALTQVMAPSSNLEYRLILSTEPRSPSDSWSPFSHDDRSSPLPHHEGDDEPLSPITFLRNEEYERSRLSCIVPAPRSSSSPSTPCKASGLRSASPVIFSQQNISSPSITLQPPPVFPSPSMQLALRLKRPLPPLPKVDTFGDQTETTSRQGFTPACDGARTSPSSSEERDDDSLTIFSPASSQSSASSTCTIASSDPAESSCAVEAYPPGNTKPRVPPLIIPARSHSSPCPRTQMPPIKKPFTNPNIAVTPATPAPSQGFSVYVRSKQRTASSTSIVLSSPTDPLANTRRQDESEAILRRTPSPAPSVSSTRSFTPTGKFTLKRMASRTRLFGRRTLSSASDTAWDTDSERTVIIVHAPSGSMSMDDKMIRPSARARSESPSSSVPVHGSAGGDDSGARASRRLEVAEVTLTPHGDVWEARELHDVIPILRQMRAPARIKM